ncbi:hypothetical protein Tco_1539970 [Tanacetum coccineum]
MQTQESKIDTGKALDNGLVVMESNGTESEVQDDINRSLQDIGFLLIRLPLCMRKHPPDSYLKWKPTGRIFKSVGLRWIPTGKVIQLLHKQGLTENPTWFKVDISKLFMNANKLVDVKLQYSNQCSEEQSP